MYLKIIICLCFLGRTLATENNNGLERKLDDKLKKCISTAIKKLCPDCVTVYLVTPTKPSWQADVLADHFFDHSPMYALQILAMDRPGYEDPLVDQIEVYLVNTKADLKIALEHLRQAKSKRKYVVWVNFHFLPGSTLSGYLKNTIPATWNLGNGQGVFFLALVGGEVKVYGTPIKKSGSCNVERFTKLSICDDKVLIEDPQPVRKPIEPSELIVTVYVRPNMMPYVERNTDNPGGFIEPFLNILSQKLNFTPKYDWSHTEDNFSKLCREDHLYLAFDMRATLQTSSASSSYFMMHQFFWVVVTRNPYVTQNILAVPLKVHVWLHLTLLMIYTGVMVYLSRDLDRSRIMLRFFGMFLGIGVGWWPRKTLLRFLVILWCFASYVLVQAYLATLTSDLSTLSPKDRIRDTADLMKYGIKIFCSKYIKEFYCNLKRESSQYICKKCVSNDKEWFLHISTNRLSMNKTFRPFAFHLNPIIYKSYFSGKPFHPVAERIGMFHSMAYTNAGERFLETVANITQALLETGIIEYWVRQYFINNATKYESESAVLSMSHLNDIFMILYVGWSCSILVFIIEILIKRGSDD